MTRSAARVAGFLALCALPWAAPPPSAAEESAAAALARGIAAFERRAEGSSGGRAAPGPIGEAVAAFEAAHAAAPRDLEVSCRLMVALWFQGEYATAADAARQGCFARGREIGERALDQLAAAVGGRSRLDAMTPAAAARALAAEPAAKPVLYWSAVHWGFWGEVFGRIAAARQGVAAKVRWRGETLAALDPVYERAGAARVLGRLHARAPRIPLVTGWVDHQRAVAELGRAVALAPEDTFNRLYFAEALAEYRPRELAARRAQLEALAAREPAADRLVEDRRNIETARALLAALR